MFTSAPLALTSQPTKFVIDCMSILADRNRKDADIEGLIEWVRTYPRKSDIQVRLPAVRNGLSRRLQRTMQAFGCTVIAKSMTI